MWLHILKKMASTKVVLTLPAQSFCCTGKSHPERASSFTAVPFCVEFQRLLRQKKPDSIIPGISVQDLLCLVVALYDVSLPNIGVEDLRANVCARGAKTIVLVRDEIEVVKEYQQKTSDMGKTDYSTTAVENFFIKKEENEKSRMLSAIFSDSESSDEDKEAEIESDQEGKDKFNTGMREFMTYVQERRQQRRQMQDSGVSISPQSIGIESRIVAAMTFQRSVLKTKEVVIQLSLLSTRKHYQHCGAGQYMVELLKDPSFVGLYDAILTHADHDAVKFFNHCGFSDDILLNSKFREFEDEWSNTTTMSFFPPFDMGKKHLMDIKDIEEEMELWKMKSLAAYQTQTILMTRMFHEIKTLRKQLSSQNEQISKMANELQKTKHEKSQLEKKVLEYKLEKAQQLSQASCFSSEMLFLDCQDEFINDFQLPKYQSAEDRDPNSPSKLNKMENVISEIKQDFIASMNESPGMHAEVKELVQASINTDVKNSLDMYVSGLIEPSLHTRLYYCGGLDQPERLNEILTSGFSIQDVQTGMYGKGLYFSSSAYTACKFSPPHQLLVADVCIGNTETVLHKEENRTSPSAGFDSILVPGRLSGSFSSQQSALSEEFVIFNHLQASPVCLLIYSTEKYEKIA